MCIRDRLKALDTRFVKSKTVLSCINSLNQLGRLTTLHLRWIKAHVGSEGNEMADSIAGYGAANPNNDVLIDIPSSYASIKFRICSHLLEKWNEIWSANDLSQIKYWFPTIAPRKAAHIKHLNRENYSRLTRWLTGHSFTNRQNKLVNPGKFPDDNCRLCHDAQERAIHILSLIHI